MDPRQIAPDPGSSVGSLVGGMAIPQLPPPPGPLAYDHSYNAVGGPGTFSAHSAAFPSVVGTNVPLPNIQKPLTTTSYFNAASGPHSMQNLLSRNGPNMTMANSNLPVGNVGGIFVPAFPADPSVLNDTSNGPQEFPAIQTMAQPTVPVTANINISNNQTNSNLAHFGKNDQAPLPVAKPTPKPIQAVKISDNSNSSVSQEAPTSQNGNGPAHSPAPETSSTSSSLASSINTVFKTHLAQGISKVAETLPKKPQQLAPRVIVIERPAVTVDNGASATEGQEESDEVQFLEEGPPPKKIRGPYKKKQKKIPIEIPKPIAANRQGRKRKHPLEPVPKKPTPQIFMPIMKISCPYPFPSAEDLVRPPTPPPSPTAEPEPEPEPLEENAEGEGEVEKAIASTSTPAKAKKTTKAKPPPRLSSRSAAMDNEKCKNKRTNFCYICARYTTLKASQRIKEKGQMAYEAYFGIPIQPPENWWTPSSFCSSCYNILYNWHTNSGKEGFKPTPAYIFEFSQPTLWRKPLDHTSDCWFCLTPTLDFKFGVQPVNFKYPWWIQSVTAPVPRDPNLPVPISPWLPEKRENEVSTIVPPKAFEVVVEEIDPEAPVLFNQERLRQLMNLVGPLTTEKKDSVMAMLGEMNLLDLTRKSVRHRRSGKRMSYADMIGLDSDEEQQIIDSGDSLKRVIETSRLAEKMQEEMDKDFVPSGEMENDTNEGQLIITINLLCPVEGCDVREDDKYALDVHLREQHQVLKFRCLAIGCAESYSARRDLMRHIAEVHTGDPGCWKCGRCAASRNDYSHLRNHIKKHHQRGQFRCGFEGCDYESVDSTKHEMEIHQKSHREPTYTCAFPACDKAYFYKTGLDRHTRSHTNDRPYKCTECEKGFFGRTDLERHLLIHWGQRPFQCQLCGKEFTLKGSLTQHTKRLHQGL